MRFKKTKLFVILSIMSFILLPSSIIFAQTWTSPTDDSQNCITGTPVKVLGFNAIWGRTDAGVLKADTYVSARVYDYFHGHNCYAEVQALVYNNGVLIDSSIPVRVDGFENALAYSSHTFYFNGYTEPLPNVQIVLRTYVWGCFTDGDSINWYEDRTFPYVMPPLNPSTPSVSFSLEGILKSRHPLLTWNAAANASYYQIYKQVKINGIIHPWDLWQTTSSTSYTDNLTYVISYSSTQPSDNWVAYKIRSVSISNTTSFFSTIGYYTADDRIVNPF